MKLLQEDPLGNLSRSRAAVIAVVFAILSIGIGLSVTLAWSQSNPISDDVDDPAAYRRLIETT